MIVFNTSSSVNLVGRQCSSVATGLCSLFDQCLILPRLLLLSRNLIGSFAIVDKSPDNAACINVSCNAIFSLHTEKKF